MVSWHTIEVEESKVAIPKNSSMSMYKTNKAVSLCEISISFKNREQPDATAHR